MTRGMRINNPCNVRITAAKWIGKITPSSDPDFEQFMEVEDGLRAGTIIIRNYFTLYGLTTIRQIIDRWAPPSDNNPTGAYVANVANVCGCRADDPVNCLDGRELCQIMGAIILQEQGYPACDAPTINAVVTGVLGNTIA